MRKFCEKAIPYLKERVTGGEAQLTVSSTDPNAPILKILECGVCVTYVVDEDEQLVFVQNRHLAEAGLTIDDLHKIALDNLLMLRREKLSIKKIGPIFGVFLDGNFEASLILLDQLWDVEAVGAVPNGFTIAIPMRDVLSFCDSKSDQGVATLREIIKRSTGGSHPVSKSLYRRVEGKWVQLPD